MSVDSRGVLRGQCQACSCDAYDGGDKGLKCVGCGHPPARHMNLTTGPATQSPPRPQISPLTASLQPSAYRAPSTTEAVATQCQFPGCTREAHFDMNSLKQYSFCRDHINVSSLPLHLGSVHLDPMEYGEPVSYPAPPTHPPVATPVQSLSPPHHTTPPTSSLVSQSTPNLTKYTKSPFLVSFGSPQKKVRSKAPLPIPLKRSMQPLQAPAPPPQSQPQPSVPPDQQCKLTGCTRPRYVEPGGRVHDFCGRTHANQYATQQNPTLANAPADLQCKTPGCTRPRRMMDDGSGYYDFCSLSCRDQGHQGSLAPSEGVTCSFPGCTRPKYVDPANNRTHDFCGRTHAFLAQTQGIVALDNVGIRVATAGSQEFTAVTGKFQRAWAKGSCPPVSFIFIINNRQLQRRWSAHQQKLSIQTVEEHYHGTVLLCNITTSNNMCNDKDCGICGISRTGFDRRCIRKNINYQRFGHGFYVAPNSSKCHDYTQGAHGYRAMLLCDVCPGRKYPMTRNDETLQGPPPGYDSVHGQGGQGSVLNYDEVVIYNPDCVLPRYVIVYQLNGTHKIAK